MTIYIKFWGLLLGIVWGLTATAEAQCEKIDSLYRILKVAKADTDRINALNNLVETLVQNSKPGKASFYARQALKMAQKAKYNKGVADALTHINLLDSRDLSENPQIINDFQKALTIYEELGDRDRTIRTLEIIGQFYAKQPDEDSKRKAITHYEKALMLYRKTENQLGIAQTHDNLGELYAALQEDNQALIHFELADKIKKELGIQNPTNDRLYAKFRRLKALEQQIQTSPTFMVIIILGIAVAVLSVMIIRVTLQRNRAWRLLKQNR
ncbi:MAG: tetratricopeptide repeat protein [Microscillaceae bacterium]|jgi:tetratricopeptide (TPR) repeat protein|nr:tetratricopeptide repeat protein [Microscillaceae bacterium]